jgi:hypothetical protein
MGAEVSLLGFAALGNAVPSQTEGESQGEVSVGVLPDHILDATKLRAASPLENHALLRLERNLFTQRNVFEHDVADEPAVARLHHLALLHLGHVRQRVIRLHEQARPHVVPAQE